MRRVPSLSDFLRRGFVGCGWGFRALKVWIRPWGPSQSEGSRLDKLGTFQNALIIPPSTPAINRVPSLERVQP